MKWRSRKGEQRPPLTLTPRDPRPTRLGHLTTIDLSLATLLRTELEEDVARGFEVFGLSAPGPATAEIGALGVRHVPVVSLTRSWDLRLDVAAVFELWRTLRQLDLDILHTHNPKSGVLGRLVGRLAGVPVVVNTCHGLWLRPGDHWAKRAAVVGVEAAAAQASHFELYQNDEDRTRLRRYVAGRRSRTVGNGVDLDRFRPDPVARAGIRRELGMDETVVLVGGVGRLVAEKGVAEFAAMARHLRGRATFVWVGPDDDKPDRVTTFDDSVRFLGFRPDMPAIYAALDIFVLPSHREGFSRSAMEAAACGCAMVLTDIRGCREVGVHEEHLLLVPPGDVGALKAAVERLVGDGDLRQRLADAAEARAQVAFDQRAVAAASIETYAEVTRRRRGRLPVKATMGPDGARRTRVLWVIKGLGLGGAERLVVLAARHIDRTRFDVEVAYLLPWKDQCVAELEADGVVVRCLGHPGGSSRGWLRRLAGLLRRQSYDVVHTHSPVAAAAVRSLPRSWTGGDLVHTEHSAWTRYRWPTKVVNALTLSRNIAVLAVSKSVAGSMRPPWLPRLRPEVEVLYHGVDVSAVRTGPEARAVARERLDIDSDRLVVGTVGNLLPKKAHDVLLDAFARLRPREQAPLLLVVGMGPLEEDLRAHAARLGVADRVRFLGRRTDVQEILPAFDVFALASRHEGLGLAVVEALAAGVPCVAAASEGLREVLRDGLDGLMVPPGDPVALAEAVDRLLDDDDLRRSFADLGPQRAASFSVPEAVKRLEVLYERSRSKDKSALGSGVGR